MKKFILLLMLIMALLIPSTVTAWDDCPRGKVCTYPGKCSRYVDTNGDGICDHGQEEPVAIAAAAEPQADVQNTEEIQGKATTDTNQTETVLNSGTISLPENEKAIPASVLPSNSKGAHREVYHLTQIILILTLLYAITHVMTKKGFIRVVTHRKIWNIALLASFLISLFLGVILIINVNFGTRISLPFDMLLWHVETGIAMGVISVFHIIWHWNYFKKMLKSLTSTA